MGSHLLSPQRCAAAVVVMAVLATVAAQAQPQNPAVQKMIELNRQALNAYSAGDFETAKTALLDAVTQGKGAGLGDDRMMARTFVHLGAVYIDGLKDRPRGVRYFVNALRLRPDIKLTPSLITPALTEAFEEGRKEASSGSPPPPMIPPTSPGPEAAAPAAPEAPAAPAATIVPAQGTGGGGDEPDLPASLASPLVCPSPDEAPPGQPIFMRCVPGSEVPVGRMLLFYRLPGEEKFTSTKLTRTPRGWWTGRIPAEAAAGKSVQFYVQALDGTGQEVASAGRVDSPTLILIRAGAAVVGEKSMPGVHTVAGASVGEENPLDELTRRPDREPGVHRRKVGLWFGLGVGTGFGQHRASKLEFRTDLRVDAGVGSAGLLYLSPEIGFQFNEYFGVSVQGRHQIIPEQTSNQVDKTPGGPARGAHSALGKFSFFAGQGNFQAIISAIVGGGEGFRVQVPPAPTGDAATSLPRNDTVRGGPWLAGAGLSLVYHFATHFALALDVKGLAGFPDSAKLIDLGLGTQFGF